MSAYINLRTLQYPIYQGDIILENPEMEFDAELFVAPDHYAAVLDTPTPDLEHGETLDELAPVEIDGVWQKVWQVRKLTVEELAVIEERATKLERMVKEAQDRIAEQVVAEATEIVDGEVVDTATSLPVTEVKNVEAQVDVGEFVSEPDSVALGDTE